MEPRLPDSPFWVEPGSVGSDHLRLDPEESHHLLRVYRAKAGTPFEATDGSGGFYECVLESVERRSVVGRIRARRTAQGELGRGLRALVGLPDWRAAERVVEHAVPLGVTAIEFAACERSGRDALGPQRIGRLGRIARAALKQSRRSRLPALVSHGSLAQAVAAAGGIRFLADTEGKSFTPELIRSAETDVLISVGPPGGFTDPERRFLLDSGFTPISLGPSRLTTETATLALLSLIRNSL